MEPYILVIEGTDGCGKQTQTNLLAEWLEKMNFKYVRQSFPNYSSVSSGPVQMMLNGEIGKQATDLDAYQASTLYAVDRLCTMQKLKQDNPEVEIILFDRYVESNMLYQACKIENLEERDNYIRWLENFEFDTLKLPRANKVIFLDMPVEKSMELVKSRTELKSGTNNDIYEQDVEFMKKTYEAGKYIANKKDWDIINCVDENDNIKSIEQINKEIKKVCCFEIIKSVLDDKTSECPEQEYVNIL